MPDNYLLNDLLQGTLLLSLMWSVAVAWFVLVVFRYIRKQQDTIDNLRAAKELLYQELEQCYTCQPSQEWMDALAKAQLEGKTR